MSPPITRQDRVEARLARAPIMLPVVVVLMWLSASAESQTLLPMLDEISVEYGLSPAQVAGALSVTGIATATTAAALCRLADIYGLRRMLLVSFAIIVAGNLVCALAPGAWTFLLGRGMVGITAATPIFYALLRTRSRDQAGVDTGTGLMTFAAGVGLCVSFLIGGGVLEFGGTARTAMWAITLLSVIVLVLAWLFVPDTPVRARSRVDYLGAVLLGLALGSVVVALGQGNDWGWGSPATVGLLAGGAVLAAVWVAWELRAPQPMMNLHVVGRRDIWPAFLVCGLCTMLGSTNSMTMSQFVKTPTEAGYGFGASALMAGVYLMPVGVMILLGGLALPPVIRAWGSRRCCIVGGLILLADFGWFALTPHHTVVHVMVELLVFGVGYAFCFTAGKSAYLRAARPGEGGMVSGAQNTIGLALMGAGPTIATALLVSSVLPGSRLPLEANYSLVLGFMATVAAVVSVCAVILRESRLDQRLAPDAVVIGDADEVPWETGSPETPEPEKKPSGVPPAG